MNEGTDPDLPRVSVVLPCYNVEQYVKEAVASALMQEGVEVEVIAVDDGSTDNTLQALLDFGDRILCLTQPNSGPSAARNRGAQESTGEFLYFLDADDVLLPGALRSLAQAIHLSGCEVAYGEVIAIGPDGEAFTGKPMGYRSPGRSTLGSLCAGTLFQPSAGMVTRRIFEVAGEYDTNVSYGEDLDIQYRWAAHTSFAKIPHAVAKYRLNPLSLTRNYPRMLESTLQVHVRNSRKFGLWRKFPKNCLVGRLKAGFYFCAEHRAAKATRTPAIAASARRCLIRHPWVAVMLTILPLLDRVKRRQVQKRLSKQAADA